MTNPLPPALSETSRTRDNFVSGMLLTIALVVIGFVLIALGKRSLARTHLVFLQLPGLVSGCITGVLLIAVGAGLAVGLHGRRVEADLRRGQDAVLEAAQRLYVIARQQESQ